MLVDCQSCVMRDLACGDCVVSLLIGPIGGSIEEHKDSFEVLANAGLVPPLRLLTNDAISPENSESDEIVTFEQKDAVGR